MKIFLVLPTALTLILLSSCKHEAAKEAEPVTPVQVTAARRDSIQRLITADAVLYPKDQASIVPKITAPVRRFNVYRGDHIRAGQVLAVLENQDLAASTTENKGLVQQAEANLKSTTAGVVPDEITKAQQDARAAKEAMDAAQKVYESRQQLLRQGAIARRLVDEANVAFVQARGQYEIAQKHLDTVQNVNRHEEVRGAEGNLEAARGRLQGAQAQLSYSEVRSPIDGVVTDRPLYAGEMASAGTPLITVMNIARVIARANIPATQAAYLKVGMSATINQSDPQIDLAGKVTVVSPAVDANTTTVQVWVEANNPGEHLRPGITVHVTIVAETIPDAIVIPPDALLPSQEGTGTSVMVVGKDMVAHERKIEIGAREADKVQIVKGLEPEERVITVGGLGLADGGKVTVGAPAKEDKKEEKEDKKEAGEK